MKKNIYLFLIIFGFILLGSLNIQAQTTAFRQAREMGKGMNLSWLENWWSGSTSQNHRDYLDLSQLQNRKNDMAVMRQMGIKTLRLPVWFHGWFENEPPYTLVKPQYYRAIDSFISWTKANNMRLIIDFHHGELSNARRQSEVLRVATLWKRIASRYANTETNHVLFEIYNEPFDYPTTVWRPLAIQIIDSIRTVAPRHTIIVGGSGWNGIDELSPLGVLPDTNLIYTFHFYDPFIFTHQGAEWVDNNGAPVSTKNIPFPYVPALMPPLNALARGTWGQQAYEGYSTWGNANKMITTLQIARNWQQTNNRPVFCGEFGSYKPFSDEASRCRHLKVTREILDTWQIPYALWEFDQGFSIFQGAPALSNISSCMRDAWGIFPNDLKTISKENIRLYPNPTTSFLTLDFEEPNFDEFIQVISPTGIIVLEQLTKGETSARIDLRNLPHGLYFLRVIATKNAQKNTPQRIFKILKTD
jgi:endoglucanase